jgi:probable H4MPT-linked C1 transfer pathway protein
MLADAIGLDIGGANLKAATASRRALCRPFELWKHPDRLAGELTAIRDRWPDISQVAVTMTGELCDCFPTKRDGVRHILASVRKAFEGRHLYVCLTNGALSPIDAWVDDHPLAAAATNWLVLAEYVGRLAPRGAAVLMDIGSTTTDVVPLLDGRPVPMGRSDPDRLRTGELVYSGVRRTPVCALLGPEVAAEFFATTHDVYVRLGMSPEEPENRGTADGRPMTIRHTHARLARMLGGDAEITPDGDTLALARRAYDRQRAAIRSGLNRVSDRLPEPPRTVILSGSGEFLARAAWDEFATGRALAGVQTHSLAEWNSPELSEAACAFALAVIAVETEYRS